MLTDTKKLKIKEITDNEYIRLEAWCGVIITYNIKTGIIYELDPLKGIIRYPADKDEKIIIGKLWHEFISRKEN